MEHRCRRVQRGEGRHGDEQGGREALQGRTDA